MDVVGTSDLRARTWPARFLAVAEAAPLWCGKLNSDEVYRLVWALTFRPVLVITIQRFVSGWSTELVEFADPRGQRQPEKFDPWRLAQRSIRPNSPSEGNDLIAAVRNGKFWTAPQSAFSIGADDGAGWLIEGRHDGYRVIMRGNVHDDTDAVVRQMMRMAGVDIPDFMQSK